MAEHFLLNGYKRVMRNFLYSILFFVLAALPLSGQTLPFPPDGGDAPYPPEVDFDFEGMIQHLEYLGEIGRLQLESLDKLVHFSIEQLSVSEHIDKQIGEQNLQSQYQVGLTAFLCGVCVAVVFLSGLKLR